MAQLSLSLAAKNSAAYLGALVVSQLVGCDVFNEDLARYRSLSPSDVRAAVEAFLPPDRRVELTVVPERPGGNQQR